MTDNWLSKFSVFVRFLSYIVISIKVFYLSFIDVHFVLSCWSFYFGVRLVYRWSLIWRKLFIYFKQLLWSERYLFFILQISYFVHKCFFVAYVVVTEEREHTQVKWVYSLILIFWRCYLPYIYDNMTIFINSLLRIFLFVVYRLPNMCTTLLWYEEFVTFFDIERIIPVVNHW